MSSFPNGTPAVNLTGVYTSTGDFSSDSMIAGIIDNYSPVNKSTLRRTIGKELSQIANFVNATYLGRSDTPVATGYITNLYTQYVEVSKESVVANSITTVLKIQSQATNVTATDGFGVGVDLYLEGLPCGKIAAYWDSRSNAHAGLKFSGFHAGSKELFSVVNTEWSDVTFQYQGNKLFKWSSADSNLDVGTGLVIDRTTGALTFNSSFLPESPIKLYKHHHGGGVVSLMIEQDLTVGSYFFIHAIDGSITTGGSIAGWALTGDSLVSSNTLMTSPKFGAATSLYYSGVQTYYNLTADATVVPNKSRIEISSSIPALVTLTLDSGTLDVGTVIYISRIARTSNDLNSIQIYNASNNNTFTFNPGPSGSAGHDVTKSYIKTSQGWSDVN